jgi:hypothetical protein
MPLKFEQKQRLLEIARSPWSSEEERAFFQVRHSHFRSTAGRTEPHVRVSRNRPPTHSVRKFFQSVPFRSLSGIARDMR